MNLKPSLLLTFFLVVSCGSGPNKQPDDNNVQLSPVTDENVDSFPGLSSWETNMQVFGKKYCNKAEILSLSTWEGSVWYYDGIRVYYQIFDYTGDPLWKTCAGYVKEVYLNYILENNGAIGAWRVFPHGLYRDYLTTGDERSRKAVILLANNSPFAAKGGGPGIELSRETAYLIHAYLLAGKLQAPTNPNLSVAVNFAIGHIDQWFISKTASYMNPFMAGLTMEALIAYYEDSHDARVPDAVRTAADWLWENAWNAGAGSFPYVLCSNGKSNSKCRETEGQAVDLNLLIAPAYAWLYKIYADPKYREEGDQIFIKGASGAFLGSGKQFSQNYRWSFDYVRWRSN
jgi:hypothetical protein